MQKKKNQNNYDHLINEPEMSIPFENYENVNNYQHKYKAKARKSYYKTWTKGITFTAGDSILSELRKYEMPKPKSRKIWTFSGAATQDMNLLIVPRLLKNPKKIVLHVEISNAHPHATPQEMYEDIIE